MLEKKYVYFKNLNRKITLRLSIEDYIALKKIAAKKGLRITVFIRNFLRAYLAKLPDSV